MERPVSATRCAIVGNSYVVSRIGSLRIGIGRCLYRSHNQGNCGQTTTNRREEPNCVENDNGNENSAFCDSFKRITLALTAPRRLINIEKAAANAAGVQRFVPDFLSDLATQYGV